MEEVTEEETASNEEEEGNSSPTSNDEEVMKTIEIQENKMRNHIQEGEELLLETQFSEMR